MKAIILAAGYATRLYPLTINRPKALLPLAGVPILDHIFEKLEKLEAVDKAYVISNDKFYKEFVAWNATKPSKLETYILNDGTLDDATKLGAIGDIKFVLDKEKIDDDIIVIAGDNYFTYELNDMYNYYKKVGFDCICAHRHDNINDLRRMAVAVIDDNNKVLNMVEKPNEPQSDVAVYATYIYRKETLPLFDEYLKEGNSPDAPGNFAAWLYKKQDLYLYLFDGECYDIGTPDSYAEVDEICKQKR